MPERRFSQDAAGLVVAHRGASASEAENTLAAFERAIASGADAIELDVRLTRDGVPVVLHDADVARTTDGRGPIRALRLDEARRLRIRTADGATTSIPTLQEALALLSGQVGLDVEIKNIPGEPDFDADDEPAVDATIRALDDGGFAGPVLVSSFNPRSLARAREIGGGQIETGLLTTPDVDVTTAFGFARGEGHPWVLPFVEAVLRDAEAVVEAVHASGMRIGTWITDDPATAVRLLRSGVDAVATNDPEAIVRARTEAFG